MIKKALMSAFSVAMLAGIISNTSVFAENKSTGVSLNVDEKLVLTLSQDALNFEASDSSLQVNTLGVTVATNAANGYTTSFNVNNNYNDLKHSNATVSESIPSISETKTESTFTDTAWAYTLDNENYTFNPLPLVPQNIFATTQKGQNNYDFNIGVRVADALAAGDYSNELIFTAIANPTPIAFSNIRTMQQMTPEICATASENEANQLQDIRDGKYYWVTKLADGNCWMTQNLDLDLSTTTTLTPEDSDITANWTPSRATIAGVANLSSYTNDKNTPYSFDPGNYYFDGTYYESEEVCNYLTITCDHFATTPYDLNGEHGHIGNYYNWSAAVASNDTSATTAAGTDMSSSICPKGWRLPHGDESTQGNDFETLNTAYGGATNSDSVLLANPLFFVRGGGVRSGSLFNSAYGGFYWLSTAYSATNADSLYFNSGYVYPSYYYNRNSGFSVRCLAHKQTQTLTIKDQSDDSVLATYDFETTYKLPEVQKEGYNLLGYTEDPTSTEPTYNVGDIITEPKTLYAIYKRPLFNMQDVATWKNYLSLEEQVQVKDTRDNKIYWVAKLKDGNIWMTQNLDYDIVAGDNIVSNLDGTTSIWNASSTYAPQATATTLYNNSGNTGTYSYDPGSKYLPNGTGTSTAITCTSTSNGGENCHYHRGNYYQYNAATAGTGGTITNTDATSSICPKGWRLPTSNSYTENYSFGKLTNAYGITNNSNGSSDSALLASPLFFARGGHVHPVSLDYQGSHGYYWSSRAGSYSYSAYLLDFNSSGVFPSNGGGSRYDGFSVRCVAL